VIKTDPAQARMQIRLALNLIRLYAVLSAPFIPDAAATLRAALGLPSDQLADLLWPGDIRAALTALPPGHGFSVPDNLFAKITDEARTDWQTRFAGIRT
jgi:methionyl-tRNA synthetase